GRRGAEPPARGLPHGPGERVGRRLGRARPDHGRHRAERGLAADLPQRRLQHLRLPQRARGLPRRPPRPRPARRRRVRAGTRLGGRAPGRDGPDPGRRGGHRRRGGAQRRPRAHEPRRPGRAGAEAAGRARGGRADLRRVRRRRVPGRRRRRARRAARRHVRRRGGPDARRRLVVSGVLTRPAPAEPSARRPERPTEHAASRRAAGGRWRRTVLASVVPLGLLAAWHVATTVTGALPSYRLPAPTAVAAAGADLVSSGVLWTHVAISTQRVVLGFLVGSGAGLVVGSLIGLSRLGDTLLS